MFLENFPFTLNPRVPFTHPHSGVSQLSGTQGWSWLENESTSPISVAQTP